MKHKFSQGTNNPGIVTNAPSANVAWSAGNNVRFGNGYTKKTPGKSLLTTIPSGSPIKGMFTFKGYDGVVRTIVCCDTNVLVYTSDFTTYIDITPTTPLSPTTQNDSWQFTLCGGMPVISNGVDRVMKWTNYSSVLETITSAPAMVKCLATVNNRVVYGWTLENSYEFTGRLRWTDIANPDIAIISKEVKGGRADLMRPSGGIGSHERIKAISSSRRIARVYTERNIWLLSPAKPPYVYQADIIAEDVSVLSTRSVVSVRGVDYCIGTDDIYMVADGVKSIGIPIRNSIQANLNKSAVGTAFAFYKPDTQEVFFCVATGNASTPNTAYIYNLELNNFAVCDVNYLSHTYSWVENVTTWDNSPFGAWDNIEDSNTWDQTDTGIIPYSIVGNSEGEILKLDEGVDDYYAGQSLGVYSYIETGDMVLSSEFKSADDVIKTVSRVFPSVKPQTTQTPLMVEVGVRDSLSDDIKWSNPMPYTIGVSRKVDFRNSGKVVRLRFSTEQKEDQWVLDGYTMDYCYRGLR